MGDLSSEEGWLCASISSLFGGRRPSRLYNKISVPTDPETHSPPACRDSRREQVFRRTISRAAQAAACGLHRTRLLLDASKARDENQTTVNSKPAESTAGRTSRFAWPSNSGSGHGYKCGSETLANEFPVPSLIFPSSFRLS
jgi:hypothetical protein